ncbi:tRNA (guanosine(37)-N1)-methyltransferase TrmD [Neisseria sp. Ec49-e6-T10]|uniref:tRNA (guanosine(37)-N1)-methyltransferase TrmD n=1 Tax=Neisseria sp. Ec49-e6-T10 TaxID=3140744 RepID=UPI003EC0F389
MHIQAISLFPEMFCAITEQGVIGRALKNKLWQFNCINPRQFTDNPLGYIDDRPFGGGPGMVMMAEPLIKAIEHAQTQQSKPAKVLYLSPQGKVFSHTQAKRLSKESGLIFLCGRYEGIDERVLTYVDEEISLGDFVVSGGELPAMTMIDAILRLKPGVLGDELSAQQDSFAQGLLDYPHYTRPASFQNMDVPEVLLSGNHALIKRWRLEQSLRRTVTKRPDLLSDLDLTKEASGLLKKIQEEQDSHKTEHKK